MAAPQWSGGKCKSIQEAKAILRHSSVDRRKDAQHTNPHIKRSLMHLNFSYRGLDYAGRCAALDARMAEIDLGRPGSGKNARTLMQSVVLYPPAALVGDKDKLKQWFMRAGSIAEARFGRNLIDIMFDFDEVHEYTEPKTGEKRVSREHGHMALVPEVDGKLNGKQFSSRKAITGFNTELEAMTVKEFGCHMLDGSKTKGGRTVEELKAASELAAQEVLQKAQEAARTAVAEAEQRAKGIIAEAEKKRQEAEELDAETTKRMMESMEEAAELDDRKRNLENEAWQTARKNTHYLENEYQTAIHKCELLKIDLERMKEARQEQIEKGRQLLDAAEVARQEQEIAAQAEEDMKVARRLERLKQGVKGMPTTMQADGPEGPDR